MLLTIRTPTYLYSHHNSTFLTVMHQFLKALNSNRSTFKTYTFYNKTKTLNLNHAVLHKIESFAYKQNNT